VRVSGEVSPSLPHGCRGLSQVFEYKRKIIGLNFLAKCLQALPDGALPAFPVIHPQTYPQILWISRAMPGRPGGVLPQQCFRHFSALSP
jgi:hypothetical protein